MLYIIICYILLYTRLLRKKSRVLHTVLDSTNICVHELYYWLLSICNVYVFTKKYILIYPLSRT
jgi:hypothetical protein